MPPKASGMAKRFRNRPVSAAASAEGPPSAEGTPPRGGGMCVCGWLAGARGNPPTRSIGRKVVLDETNILGCILIMTTDGSGSPALGIPTATPHRRLVHSGRGGRGSLSLPTTTPQGSPSEASRCPHGAARSGGSAKKDAAEGRGGGDREEVYGGGRGNGKDKGRSKGRTAALWAEGLHELAGLAPRGRAHVRAQTRLMNQII